MSDWSIGQAEEGSHQDGARWSPPPSHTPPQLVPQRGTLPKGRPVPFSLIYKLTCLIAGCMQSALMGGVIFGISSVSDSFLSLSTPEGGPELSAVYIHAMYVLATLFAALAPIGSGLVLESGGPRISSALSTLIFATGCGLFALSDNDTCMFLPAICLMAFAGPGVHAATMHISNLFHEGKGVATVCLSASFHLSFGCLYVVEGLFLSGWDYRQIFTLYATIALVSMSVSLVLWPDEPFEQTLELTGWEGTPGPPTPSGSSSYSYGSTGAGSDSGIAMVSLAGTGTDNNGYESPRSRAGSELPTDYYIYKGSSAPREGHIVSMHPFGVASTPSIIASPPSTSTLTPTVAQHPPNTMASSAVAANKERHKNIRAHIAIATVASRSAMEPLEELGPYDDLRLVDLYHQLASPIYRQLAILFVICSFWANFYPGVAVREIGDVYGKMGQNGFTAEERADYGCKLSLIMMASLIVIPLSASAMDCHSYAYSGLAFVMGLLLLLWSFLLLYQTPGTLLFSFGCYATFRSLLYSFTYSYMQQVFGGDNFGVLVGCLHLLAGVIGLLQLPLADWASGNCHQAISSLDFSVCSTGSWAYVNFAAALSSGYCFYLAYNDWAVRFRLEQRKARIGKEIATHRKRGTQLLPNVSSRGVYAPL